MSAFDPKKPFPPPPRTSNRDGSAKRQAAEAPPFTEPPVAIHDPRLTDDEYLGILKQYLRPEQLANTKLLLFIFAYLESRSSAQASREAGISNGAYWRSRPEVHAVIEALTVKMVMKYGYDAEEVVARAKEIATIDPIVFQKDDGSFVNKLADIPAEARRAIKKLKVKNLFEQDENGIQRVVGEIIEIEVWDKLKGIELLGREKNIFKQTTVHEHDMTANMKSVLLESGNRAEERLRLMAARDVGGSGGESAQGAAGDSGSEDGGRELADDRVSVGEQGGQSAGAATVGGEQTGQGGDEEGWDQSPVS